MVRNYLLALLRTYRTLGTALKSTHRAGVSERTVLEKDSFSLYKVEKLLEILKYACPVVAAPRTKLIDESGRNKLTNSQHVMRTLRLSPTPDTFGRPNNKHGQTQKKAITY
jgi:hypothetical protein